MLDDDAGGRFEAAGAFPGGVGVRDVVVGQFLALQLAVVAQQAGLTLRVDVEGGGLVRVLAVAQGLLLLDLQGQGAGPFVAGRHGFLLGLGVDQAGQVGGDGAVVGGGVGVDLGGQRQAQAVGGVAALVHFGQHARVVDGVDHHGHAAGFGAVVLGRRAQHGRAADVDVFDGVGEGAVRLGHGFAERIQVDHQHVDTVDARRLDGVHVLGAVAARQQAAMDLRVQRLDAAIENFGRTRVGRHFGDGQAGVGQQLGGAAGGQQAHAARGQGAGKFNDAGLVGHRKQGGFDFHGEGREWGGSAFLVQVGWEIWGERAARCACRPRAKAIPGYCAPATSCAGCCE